MHELYELRDMLCDELKDYGKKGGLTAGSLQTIDTLAHALKNLLKIIAMREKDSSGLDDPADNRPDEMSVTYRGTYRGSTDNYSRSRDAHKKSDGDVVDQLHELMANAPSDQIRQEMQALIERIEYKM